MTPSPWREHWSLNPAVTFLNHGSFGACPLPVLAAQRALTLELERDPVQFMLASLPERLSAARRHVAELLGASPDDLGFTTNATDGVNAVLRSLAFQPGDELLVTDHGYAACSNVARFVAERTGAVLRVARVPFPVEDPQRIVTAIVAAASAHTRLALIDHVTSITGSVWPIAEIVRALRERGIETLVDGAHAPGMVDLGLDALGAGYYAANFHKWGCAPKGAAFLWVRRDLQREVLPTVISHGYGMPLDRRFRSSFDWQGTRDPSPWLCVPAAIDFLRSLLPGGLPAVLAHNRALAIAAQAELCARLGIEPPVPRALLGALVSVPLALGGQRRVDSGQVELYHRLLARGFEVLVQPWPDECQLVVRLSLQLYNTLDEVRSFAEVLLQEVGHLS